MHKKLAVIFLLLAVALSAQNKTEYKLISLEDENDVPLESQFYIENVYDGRQLKNSIGMIQKGITNRKVLANFEKPLETEIRDYMAKIYPKREGAVPVSLRVNELYISEYTEAATETGYASIVADVIEYKNNGEYIAGTYSSTIEGTGMDVTRKHDDRIKKALQQCMGRYIVTPPEEKLAIPYDKNAPIMGRVALKPEKGIYVSYKDLISNKPNEASNYYLKSKEDKYHLVNSTTGKKEENYYAYSDGEDVYLNVSRYALSKYYAKTYRIADKYFINDVHISEDKAVNMGAVFGLVGLLSMMALDMDETNIPMMIDVNTGQPYFLEKSTIKTMLGERPDLLKEYKKSNRTTEDVRNIFIKFYTVTGK